jgi:two-component system, OmpR family, sensor kinase
MTSEAPSAATPEAGRRRCTIGVRSRILATVLGLTSLGMIMTGAASIAVEQRQMLDHVNASLQADVEEFRAYTQSPDTGSGQTSNVSAILRTALERQATTADEVAMGMVDGRPAFVIPGRRPFAIESDTELISQIAALGARAPTRIRDTTTTLAGPIRYAAVQVQVAGKPERGTLVIAASLNPVHQALIRSIRLYSLLSVAALLVIGLGGWLVAGRLLRPLTLLREAADRISHTDLTSRIPVTGRDDVTDLTRTVNTMLDRLQVSFESQQQFLDDAGHELRTPLTIVRGHLEVLDPTDPAEVRATRHLAMDELDRMARIVHDLIILAQAGQPDFVRYRTVDLDQLLADILDKAQGLADRHWVLDPPSRITVLADGQRITQALLQLIDNAVKHTTEDDVIAIGGAERDGRTRLWVRDTGTGVSPQDAQRIFERFGRGGASRAVDGSGLGLSIVGGIARGHGGGRVVLESAPPGAGAQFTLELPLVVLRRGESWVFPSPATDTRPPAGQPGRRPKGIMSR